MSYMFKIKGSDELLEFEGIDFDLDVMFTELYPTYYVPKVRTVVIFERNDNEVEREVEGLFVAPTTDDVMAGNVKVREVVKHELGRSSKE